MMSDTFNHEADAWDSLEQADDVPMYHKKTHDQDKYPNKGFGNNGGSNFSPDPLYYHTKIKFTELTSEVSNAYLIDDRWIPKRICRELDLLNKTVWVHTKIYESLMDEPPVPKLSDKPF